ncbi:MAG: hypothetical protein U0797_23890 [Gemmataceae bacterium]
MGGFPCLPEKKESPGSLQEFIRENLSKLRGAGTLRLYGLLRGDFDYATARFATDTENPFFVLPNDSRFRSGQNFVPVKPNDTNYALYPRLTRLGAEFYGTPIDCLGGAVTSGRFECDFLTNEFINNAAIAALNPESRPLMRLRLAYVTLTADEFTLPHRAGLGHHRAVEPDDQRQHPDVERRQHGRPPAAGQVPLEPQARRRDDPPGAERPGAGLRGGHRGRRSERVARQRGERAARLRGPARPHRAQLCRL